MTNYHMSDDGVPRKCSAQTPESCTAGKAEGLENKHFDNSKDAEQAYGKVMQEKYGDSSLSKKNRKTGDVPIFTKSDTKEPQKQPKTGNVPIFAKRDNANSDIRAGKVPEFRKSNNPVNRDKTGDVPLYKNNK